MPSPRLSVAALLCLSASPALATDVLDAELAGAGGTSVAALRSNTHITNNPAALGLVDRYDAGAMFVGGPEGALRWNAAIIDARTSERVAFGVAYNGAVRNPYFVPSEIPSWVPSDEEARNRQQTHDITLGLGFNFLERTLGVGLNGTLSIRDSQWFGTEVTGNVDVGFAYRPIPEFGFAVTGSDLLPIQGQGETPTRFTLGMRGGKEGVFVGMLDVVAKAEQFERSPMALQTGVEGSIKVVALRAGYNWDHDRTWQHEATVGFSLFNELGTIGYAMRVPVITDGSFHFKHTAHHVSLTVYTKLLDKEAEEEPISW